MKEFIFNIIKMYHDEKVEKNIYLKQYMKNVKLS